MSRTSTKVRNFATKVIDITLTITNAEAATADVVADFQSFDVNSASEAVTGTINYMILADNDDSGIQLDVLFSDKQSAPVLGTENDVVAISDGDAATIIGRIDTGATSVDLVAAKIVVPSAFTPIPFTTANGSLYVGVVNRGAATTWTASGITLRLGLTIE